MLKSGGILMKVYIISDKRDFSNWLSCSSDIGNITNDDYCFISFSADLEKVREKSSFIQTENLFCLEDVGSLELLDSLLKEKSTILVNL